MVTILLLNDIHCLRVRNYEYYIYIMTLLIASLVRKWKIAVTSKFQLSREKIFL